MQVHVTNSKQLSVNISHKFPFDTAGHLNGDNCLLVLVGVKHLRFLGRDNIVSGNQLCHHSTNSIPTVKGAYSNGEGSNIQIIFGYRAHNN